MNNFGTNVQFGQALGGWELLCAYIEIQDTGESGVGASRPVIGQKMSVEAGDFNINTLATSTLTFTFDAPVEDILVLGAVGLSATAEGGAGYIFQYASRDVANRTVTFVVHKVTHTDADPVVTAITIAPTAETVKGWFSFLVKRTTT